MKVFLTLRTSLATAETCPVRPLFPSKAVKFTKLDFKVLGAVYYRPSLIPRGRDNSVVLPTCLVGGLRRRSIGQSWAEMSPQTR